MDRDIEKIFQLAVERINDPLTKAECIASREEVLAAALPQEAIEEEAPGSEQNQALANLIREMSIPQKIKLALFGNHTARTLLIRDSNRMVAFFVLENARLTDNEIVEISRNSQLDDGILRAVSNNQQWMKSYAIKVNIVSNPKTPIDAALKWLKFIKDKDLARLGKSKNVPQVIANQARKLSEKRGGP
jgi:hypothetical protein